MLSPKSLAATVAVAILLLSDPTLAGTTCTKVGSKYYCGGVINKSSDTMRWTDNPNTSSSSVTTYCKFWNWSGGDEGTSGPRLKCTQHDVLFPPGKVGGGGSKKTTDVDAFTFPSSDYIVDFGGLRRVTKSVWTRIHDDQIITCKDSGGLPLCS